MKSPEFRKGKDESRGGESQNGGGGVAYWRKGVDFEKRDRSGKRCCGSGSALSLIGWIRIQVSKNNPQKRKSEEMFIV